MTGTDQQIAETLEWLRASAVDGTEFMKQEAPLWANELLSYAAYGGWISLGGSLLVLLASSVLLFKGTKRLAKGLRNADAYDEVPLFLALAILWAGIGLFFALPAFLTAWGSCDQLLKVYKAPRVYIVENLPKF